VVIGTFEPEFPVSRIVFTKLCTIMTILDYFYHAHGSLDDLKLLAEGVKRDSLYLICKKRIEDWIVLNSDIVMYACKF